MIVFWRGSLLDGVAGAPLLPDGGLDAGHGLVQIGVRLVEWGDQPRAGRGAGSGGFMGE